MHKQHRHGYVTGYTLLFNLDTSQLLELNRITGKDNEQQRTNIEVTSMCKPLNEAK